MTLSAIIDCDPGHDDVMAILLAARTMDVRGITTVHGNASLVDTTRNARQVVEFAELTSIPIAKGFARPLARAPRYAPGAHGESGLDGPTLAPPTVALHPQHAIDYILDSSHSIPDLHLIPIGPLTNIAAALNLDPTLASRIKQISLMGGSLTFGNATPAAEFNILCDPEAAHVVFTSGIPIKMIGLNASHQVLALPEYRQRIRSMGTITSTHAADMLDFYSHGEGSGSGLPGAAMHDPLAVAALIDPDILTFEPMHVAVEVHGTHPLGMTLCDGRHLGADFRTLKPRRRGAEPNAEVAVVANAKRFWDLFLDVLATYP
jgi:inosine-uridine nucleoside N-ribohydrolase